MLHPRHRPGPIFKGLHPRHATAWISLTLIAVLGLTTLVVQGELGLWVGRWSVEAAGLSLLVALGGALWLLRRRTQLQAEAMASLPEPCEELHVGMHMLALRAHGFVGREGQVIGTLEPGPGLQGEWIVRDQPSRAGIALCRARGRFQRKIEVYDARGHFLGRVRSAGWLRWNTPLRALESLVYLGLLPLCP